MSTITLSKAKELVGDGSVGARGSMRSIEIEPRPPLDQHELFCVVSD